MKPSTFSKPTLGLSVWLVILVLSCSLSGVAQAGSRRPSEAFDVATIKLSDPHGRGTLGFMSYPGGKVVIGGATVSMLLEYAFDLQPFQILGVPEPLRATRFDVVGIPPGYAEGVSKQDLTKARPDALQRQMIQRLLVDRFGLMFHHASKVDDVFFLTRSGSSDLLVAAKDKDRDPRGGIMIDMQGVPTGDCFGSNFSMELFAKSIGTELGRIVFDETGLVGSYDFRVKASEPSNGDPVEGVLNALGPLGLKLKLGKAPVDVVVIDHIQPPNDN